MYEIVIVLLCISLAIDPQSQVQRPDRILPWPTEYILFPEKIFSSLKHVLLSLIVLLGMPVFSGGGVISDLKISLHCILEKTGFI